MKKMRTLLFFPAVAIVFSIVSSAVAAQTIPASIRSLLDRNYPGWRFHSGDRICKSRAAVMGDFDGNGKLDYAVMFKKGRAYYIAAFLASGAAFRQVLLESDASANSFLALARKGERYAPIINDDLDRDPVQELKADAPVSGGCESSSYLYIYANGRFKRVFTSD